MSPFKTSLSLEAMESREVPAVIGWVKGGPQPEPPTAPTSSVKFGILLPALQPVASQPVAVPNGILFPVFVGR